MCSRQYKDALDVSSFTTPIKLLYHPEKLQMTSLNLLRMVAAVLSGMVRVVWSNFSFSHTRNTTAMPGTFSFWIRLGHFRAIASSNEQSWHCVFFAYHHQGKQICLKAFLFLHSIGSKRLKNLFKSFHVQGILPRAHGNLKRLPSHTLSFKSVQQVLAFIANYAEENSILLPGCIPGYKSCEMKLLPSSK